jgi:hypothetical protein
MTSPQRFPVVLFWHMHQPQYRDPLNGEYILPWTYLHAIKDYVDMAAHLEDCPGARAVVNFAPILLEQLEELATRVQEHLRQGVPLPDPVLRMPSWRSWRPPWARRRPSATPPTSTCATWPSGTTSRGWARPSSARTRVSPR